MFLIVIEHRAKKGNEVPTVTMQTVTRTQTLVNGGKKATFTDRLSVASEHDMVQSADTPQRDAGLPECINLSISLREEDFHCWLRSDYRRLERSLRSVKDDAACLDAVRNFVCEQPTLFQQILDLAVTDPILAEKTEAVALARLQISVTTGWALAHKPAVSPASTSNGRIMGTEMAAAVSSAESVH